MKMYDLSKTQLIYFVEFCNSENMLNDKLLDKLNELIDSFYFVIIHERSVKHIDKCYVFYFGFF